MKYQAPFPSKAKQIPGQGGHDSEIITVTIPTCLRQVSRRSVLALRARISGNLVTTTHSPFIINPENVEGYRRVRKDTSGTKNLIPNWSGLEVSAVKRHLEWRGNLEGLFADRVVLIEGGHDENFYERLRSIFDIPLPANKFTLFVKSSGRKQLRIVRDFYRRMSFDDVAIVADLDYLFSSDAKLLFEQVELDPSKVDGFRGHVGWSDTKNPSLETILAGLEKNGDPLDLATTLDHLEGHRVFVLRHRAPEHYYKNDLGKKAGWVNLQSESDLLKPDYLKILMKKILSQD